MSSDSLVLMSSLRAFLLDVLSILLLLFALERVIRESEESVDLRETFVDEDERRDLKVLETVFCLAGGLSHREVPVFDFFLPRVAATRLEVLELEEQGGVMVIKSGKQSVLPEVSCSVSLVRWDRSSENLDVIRIFCEGLNRRCLDGEDSDTEGVTQMELFEAVFVLA